MLVDDIGGDLVEKGAVVGDNKDGAGVGLEVV